MEPVTVAVTVGVIMRYVLPAIKSLGARVLEKSEESASDEIVGFGRRLLRTILGNGRDRGRPEPGIDVLERGVERRVLAVASTPGPVETAQLAGAIEDLLLADPALRTEIVQVLGRAPKIASVGDRTTNVGGSNLGTILTGDGNSITYGR